jgi:hypothetical protein
MNIKKNIAVSDSGMIFNPDTGETFSVNPIGASIIHDIKEGINREGLSKNIVTKYAVDPPTFEKDFDDFVSMLRNFSLFEDEE